MADLLSPEQFMGPQTAAPQTGLIDPQTFFGSAPPVGNTGAPEGNASAMLQSLGKEGYQPTALDRGLAAFNDFTGQAKRAASMGLTDKVAAAVPAVNKLIGDVFTQGAQAQGNMESGAAGVPQSTPAAASGPSASDLYHQELAHQRQMGETYAQNHPVASKIATGLGIAGSAGMAGREAAAATLAGQIGQGIKGGAAVGGLAGFGNSNDESPAQTAIDTAEGVGVGGVVGAAAPVAAKVVQPVIDLVARRFGPSAVENQAVRTVAQRMAQDAHAGGPKAQDMLDLLNVAADKPQTLADVAGANTRALAGSITRQQGPAQQDVTGFLDTRDAGAGTRLAADVDAGISNGPSAFQTQQALSQARAAAAAPKYEAAFSRIKTTPEEAAKVQRFIADPIGQQALQQGMRVIQLEKLAQGQPFNPADYGVTLGQDGNYVLGDGVPNLRLMDAVKRGYDEIVEGFRDPTSGKLVLNQYGRAVNDVRAAYVKDLREMFPRYASALDAWSGPSASKDAVSAGQNLFNMTPEQIQDRISRLSPNDKEFFKLGAADAIKQKVAKTGMEGNEARSLVNTDWAKGQVRPLFDSDDAYQRFMNAATAENRMFKTRTDLLKGSQTAGRVAEDAANEGHGLAGHVMQAGTALAEGAPVAATLAGVRALRALATPFHQNPEVNSAIGRILFTPGVDANRQMLARILMAQNAPSRLPAATVPTSVLAARLLPQALRGGSPTQIPYLGQGQ